VAVSPQWAGPIQEDPVSAFLFRLGRSSARHPFRVVGLWVLAAIAIMVLQGSAGGEFEDSERVPGVESQHAADVLSDRFPSHGGLAARIVVHTDQGRLDDADHADVVDAARAQLTAGVGVAGVTDPFAPDSAALSADGQTAYLDVAYALDKLTARQSTTPLPSPTQPVPRACRWSSPVRWRCWPRTSLRASSSAWAWPSSCCW
jgi:uncharacterized membrane protein YdfJ with MMPL/SSD domain